MTTTTRGGRCDPIDGIEVASVKIKENLIFLGIKKAPLVGKMTNLL